MKKYVFLFAIICVVLVGFFAGCKEEKKVEQPVLIEEPAPVVPYEAKHTSSTIDLKGAKTYQYVNAPNREAAVSVSVEFPQVSYSQPIEVKYTYSNGDTHTYIIPSEFGIWRNEANRLRVVKDKDNTVWVQGQTKSGKFHEFIFYGNPKFNGTKIKPNSYLNHPNGLILYC